MPNRLWGRRRSGHADDLDRLEREITICCDRIGFVSPTTGCSDEACEENGALLQVERRASQTHREPVEDDAASNYETVPSSPNLSVSGDDNKNKLMVMAERDLPSHELADSTASLLQARGGRYDHNDDDRLSAVICSKNEHKPLTSTYLEENDSELLMLPLPHGRIYVKCKELQAYNIVIFTENGIDKRYNLRDIVCRIVNRQPCDKIETRIVEHWLKMVAQERRRNESISVTTNAMLALFVTVGALLCTLLVSCVFQVVPAVKALLGRKQP